MNSDATAARFICHEPVVDGAQVQLCYSATNSDGNSYDFTETVTLPSPVNTVADALLQPVLRLLSFAASLSYFKAFAPAVFEVPGGLTQTERTFITELLRNGLGEFAFVNQLPEVFDTVIAAPQLEATTAEGQSVAQPEAAIHATSRALVAVGGGKDSIVSIEALKQSGIEVGLFAVNARKPMLHTAERAQLPLVGVKRAIDRELLALNAAGAPNGHVPVTAINSLIAILTAMVAGYDAVVFSNEASSSTGNFDWSGREINHQWSKGLAFEQLLRGALPAGAPTYVSLLRPIKEIRIARSFARHTQYHDVFTSCNQAFRLTSDENATWCGNCAKCRFVFLILAPFVSRDELLAIFNGDDLFADESQLTGFLELFASGEHVKPFECVGEAEECRVALTLIREHDDWASHPFLAHPEIAALSSTGPQRETVFGWSGAHCLPTDLEAIAREI